MQSHAIGASPVALRTMPERSAMPAPQLSNHAATGNCIPQLDRRSGMVEVGPGAFASALRPSQGPSP